MRGAPMPRRPAEPMPEVQYRQVAPPPRTAGKLTEEPGGSSSSGFGIVGLVIAGAVGAGAAWWWFKGRHEGLTLKVLSPKGTSAKSAASEEPKERAVGASSALAIKSPREF